MKAASATVAAMTHGFTFGFQICSVMARLDRSSLSHFRVASGQRGISAPLVLRPLALKVKIYRIRKSWSVPNGTDWRVL
jgi:hypothetical protein